MDVWESKKWELHVYEYTGTVFRHYFKFSQTSTNSVSFIKMFSISFIKTGQACVRHITYFMISTCINSLVSEALLVVFLDEREISTSHKFYALLKEGDAPDGGVSNILLTRISKLVVQIFSWGVATKDDCHGDALRACTIVFILIQMASLQEIAKIFSVVYLHFGKLQSNTFTERIPKMSTD